MVSKHQNRRPFFEQIVKIMSYIRAIIAGGGTGGHLFPGIAVARELERRFSDTDILFVVGKKKIESEILTRSGFEVKSIDVEGLKGRGWRKGLTVMSRLPKSLMQSKAILKAFSPAFILGMGGYSAGPVCVAGRFMGIPTAIHEQNSYPGLTNRLLSKYVDRIFISFEESRTHFKHKTPVLTGNPVREEFFSMSKDLNETRQDFTVMVVGGSQGAKAINRIFAEALLILKNQGKQLSVIHQTGRLDHEHVVADYEKKGLQGELLPFIQDMIGAYKRADLVVGRAGATTIFELAALGKPSILIPFPYAANRHQEVNANSLVVAGGAEMIPEHDLTGEVMANSLINYMENPSLLKEMGNKARKIARPNAARDIVDQLMEISKTNEGDPAGTLNLER